MGTSLYRYASKSVVVNTLSVVVTCNKMLSILFFFQNLSASQRIFPQCLLGKIGYHWFYFHKLVLEYIVVRILENAILLTFNTLDRPDMFELTLSKLEFFFENASKFHRHCKKTNYDLMADCSLKEIAAKYESNIDHHGICRKIHLQLDNSVPDVSLSITFCFYR